MSDENNAMYKLGQQARSDGYGRDACNIRNSSSASRIRLGWWLAGWHDEDMRIELDMRYLRKTVTA